MDSHEQVAKVQALCARVSLLLSVQGYEMKECLPCMVKGSELLYQLPLSLQCSVDWAFPSGVGSVHRGRPLPLRTANYREDDC